MDHKRGEVNELRGLLRSPKVMRDQVKLREVTKKVIAYMTLGIDVSKLFSEMIMASPTKDLVMKKMIYLYLCNYAERKKDLAVLAINTLQKDSKDDDPMIRGLALRSLCSLKLPNIAEYVGPLLRLGVKDTSSYVRKTAAMGCAKLFRVSAETFHAGNWASTLKSMLNDRDPAVALNCLCTLNEVYAEEGGLEADSKTALPLLKRIKEFNEWGQCMILDLCARYVPGNQQEMFGIMNHLDPLLKHSNCAVVLGTTKVYLNYTRNLPKVHFSVIQRLKVPLLTLMSSSSVELSYTVLSHVRILVSRAPHLFAEDYKHFFLRYNDPACIKKIKLEVLVDLSTPQNSSELINELSEYITDVSPEIAKQAIKSIGEIAAKIEDCVDEGIELLLSFLELSTDYVTSETCIVLKDVLRKYPDRYEDVIPSLQKCLKSVEAAEGRVAVIWLIGEYGDTIDDAPYILEPLINNFAEEGSNLVRIELLTATMKLFFKRPPELKNMLGVLLKKAVEEKSQVDVRDQALFYYRLLRYDVHEAARIVNCEKVKVRSFVEAEDTEAKDQIFDEFNSLSAIYGIPSARFNTYRKPESFEPPAGTAPPAPTQGDVKAAPPITTITPRVPMEVKKTAPPPVQIDILASLADPTPTPVSGGGAVSTLVAKASLDSGSFKKKWGGLGKTGTAFESSLKTPVPSVKAMGAVFRSHHMNTIASGAKGGIMKFYLYAQSAKDKSYFLVEANLQISSGRFAATIKCENKALITDFEAELKQALAGAH